MRRQAVTDLLLGKEKTNKKVERKFNVFDSSPTLWETRKQSLVKLGRGDLTLLKRLGQRSVSLFPI